MENQMPDYKWQDIKDEFFTACQDLRVGELVHDTHFGLMEAMSAIALMDPKMDAGMVCNQSKNPVLPLEKAIEINQVKVKDLTSGELIGIMDTSLSCLVTWLEGHSLAQTVFTNLYLHNPNLIEDKCLLAFSLGQLKIIDLIRDAVMRANVFEEEDFQVMTYGFKLASDWASHKVSALLREAEDEILKKLRSMKNDSEGTNEEVIAQMQAVVSRLKFTRSLIQIFLSFAKEKCTGMEDALRYCKQAEEAAQNCISTSSLGMQPKQTDERIFQDFPCMMGFEPLINQRLLPPSFPRSMKIVPAIGAYEHLIKVIQRFERVTEVSQVNSLQSALNFFAEFSENSCVISRSVLLASFLPTNKRVMGQVPFVEYLKEACKAFTAPPFFQFKSVSPDIKDKVDIFFIHCVAPFAYLIEIYCHNRARQRCKFAQALEEFSALQEEAERLDEILNEVMLKMDPNRKHLTCFSNWITHFTVHAMIQYLISGCELDLYAIHEYYYVLWYLYEVLLSWQISIYSRAEGFLIEHDAFLDKQKNPKAGKKNKRKPKARVHEKSVRLVQAKQNIYAGLFKVLQALQSEGKIPAPDASYTDEEIRYNHRMTPFAAIYSPPVVVYQHFKETMQALPQLGVETLLEAAFCYFHQAKNLLEELPKVKEANALVLICKNNGVVARLLQEKRCREKKEPIRFDFNAHLYFPLLKINI